MVGLTGAVGAEQLSLEQVEIGHQLGERRGAGATSCGASLPFLPIVASPLLGTTTVVLRWLPLVQGQLGLDLSTERAVTSVVVLPSSLCALRA